MPSARTGRRLFRSTLLGCTAGLLLALDGMVRAQPDRAAGPDGHVLGLVAFAALVVDRDRARERLADQLEAVTAGRFGPGLGWRPWRLVAGLALGMACATKWSGIYFVAVFGLMTVLWDMGARRTAGVRRPWLGALLRDAGPAFLSLVVVALVVYLASWTGWFLADDDDAFYRGWATENPGPPLVPDASTASGTTTTRRGTSTPGSRAYYPYRSNPGLAGAGPSGVLLLQGLRRRAERVHGGPVRPSGHRLGTPAIWWAACLALPVLVYLWAGRRDWRAGRSSPARRAGYLRGSPYQERTIFSFYAVAFVPYLCLAIALCLGLVLGPRTASATRRQWARPSPGVRAALVANFAYLLPVISAQVLPYADWYSRMWWKSRSRSAVHRPGHP